MGFWSKNTGKYWMGVALQHLGDKKPEQALAAAAHLYPFKQKEDQDSQVAFGVAAFVSGCAYVQLKDWSNARMWLDIFEAMNPPNKQWLETLRTAVENLEAESKNACLGAIEMLEAFGGKEGVLLVKGFRDMERGSHEEAIEALNEVLKSCGTPDSQMGAKEREEYDQKISMALLGLVLSYSGLAQLDKAKEYLEMLGRINPKMAEEFRKTWAKSPPHI
jgi:tetratricopeptide (TPR) repeat protein